MLLQLTPTLLSFPRSPPPPSQNSVKGSHYLCVSPYFQYFITSMLQMGTLKPSFFTKPSTLESSMFSPWLLLQLSTPIPCGMKH